MIKKMWIRCEKKTILPFIMAVILVVLLSIFSVPVHKNSAFADNESYYANNQRVVKVGFPFQKGLTEFDKNGNLSGYSYEYLQEVAQYNRWEYDFVTVDGSVDDSFPVLLDKLKNDEIDLMVGMVMNDEALKIFDFASYGFGRFETVLQTTEKKANDFIVNSQIDQRYKIAVIKTALPEEGKEPQAGGIVSALEEYCAVNKIIPEYVACEDLTEQIQAVIDGRADMMLSRNIIPAKGMQTIARFNSSPMYIVTKKGGDPELLTELNAGILKVDQNDPYFTTKLFEKYFSNNSGKLTLSEDEIEFINSSGCIKVGFLTAFPPYQYSRNGLAQGIFADILKHLTQILNLQFKLVFVDEMENMASMLSDGTIDMMLGLPYDYQRANMYGVSMTRPIISSPIIILANRSVNGIGSSIAAVRADPLLFNFAGKVQLYDTQDECVDAVNNGKADFTYTTFYTAQYYLNLLGSTHMQIVSYGVESSEFCFGVQKNTDMRLLSVLNKAITTWSNSYIQTVVNNNIVVKQKMSLANIIRDYPTESALVLIVLFLLVFGTILLAVLRKLKAHRQQLLEFTKHQRVYGLINEYFFEFNCKTKQVSISVPTNDSVGKTAFIYHDLSKPYEDEAQENRRQAFLKVILETKSGVVDALIPSGDSGERWLRFALDTIYDGSIPAFILGKITDIDDEKRKEQELLERSRTDSLTRLYNKETTIELLKSKLDALEKEYGAFIILDIDKFKNINDTYGHQRGDEILIELSRTLEEVFGEEKVVGGSVLGRDGGDEFVIYVENIKSKIELSDLCKSLNESARKILVDEGLNVTLSVGAAITAKGDVYENVYRAADNAMYHAKRSGRDGYYIDDSAMLRTTETKHD